MNYAIQGLILCFFVMGANLFWQSINKKNGNRSSKLQLNKYKAYLMKEFQSSEANGLVQSLGFKSGLAYQLIRYSILTVWLLYIVYMKFSIDKDIIVMAAIWIAVFFISSPRKRLFMRESPFMFVVKQIQKNKRMKLNLEIYRCLSQLKNLAVAKAEARFSGDHIICELSKFTTHAKPILNRMLGYWYEGRYEEAANHFINAVGTDDAKALAGLLLKIDYLKPQEFISQLELYQNEAKERRKTAAQKTKENKSHLIYGLVMLSGVCILANFLVVSIAIDAFEYYKNLIF